MPQDNSGDSEKIRIARRSYLSALVATGFAGLAGCGSGDDGDTPTATDTPTTSDGQSPSTETTDTEVTETERTEETATETPQEQEPVSDRIRTTALTTVPGQSNLNPWGGNTQGYSSWFWEITNPRINQGEPIYNGTEIETPHLERDSVPIIAWLDNIEIEPPFDFYRSFRDDLTYWDGTTLDAEAHVLHDKLWYFHDGNKFDDTATFNSEVVSEFEYHAWRDKGDVEGQDPDPTNSTILRSQAADVGGAASEPPYHPSFTRPYVQQYEDASSEDEVSDITSELQSDRISYFDYANNGYGSGLYQIESENAITATEIILQRRDDHPNDYATIDELEIKIAEADRVQALVLSGEVDIGGGIVQKGGGGATYHRSQLPDHIQEVDRFLDTGGDQLLFNWNNDHLQNLWVRRAVVAAVDWIAVGQNGWGPERSIPMSNHTGLLDVAAGQFFPSEFLDQLHQWPMRSDFDLAQEYMERAGYTKTGGTWKDPDGEAVELNLLLNSAIADWVGALQTVVSNLNDLGFDTNLTGVNWSAYGARLAPDSLNYDISLQWAVNTTDIWEPYWSAKTQWSDPLIAGAAEGPGPVQPEDEFDNQGVPLQVQIPSQVGSIEAPEQAGVKPDLSSAGIDSIEINVADLIHEFRRPEASDENFQEAARLCARFYNYYLPDFWFHQYTWGVWGNVRDFQFPPRGNRINQTTFSTTHDNLLVLGGFVQEKYDQEYEEP